MSCKKHSKTSYQAFSDVSNDFARRTHFEIDREVIAKGNCTLFTVEFSSSVQSSKQMTGRLPNYDFVVVYYELSKL